jgi:hypothetical protein
MNLVDMKRPKKSKEEAKVTEGPVGVEERYPWGLRLTLEKEELAKLGLKPADLAIGSKCAIQCEGEVVGLRESASKEPEREQKSVEIQIVKMAIGGGKKGAFQEYSEEKKKGPGR